MESGTDRDGLVVDDERYIVDLLRELLEADGYRVRSAGDGVAALDEVGRGAPDLVITDVMMPRLGGIELADRLRERGIPTIVMSAAISAVDDPCLVFLPKPFDIDHLLAVVASTIDTC